MNLRTLDTRVLTITHQGLRYYVTTGTGETSFGRRGGSCAFAYLADDVDELPQYKTYAGFCDAISPEDDIDLAYLLAAKLELRLTHAGACTPVLSDDQWDVARKTVDTLDALETS